MDTVFRRIKNELASLQNNSLLRTPHPPMGHDFSSNDYFCLSRNPAIIASVRAGVKTYGYGSTSSRFIRGERDIYRVVEDALANFMRTERCLLFSSGYSANLGVLTALIKKDDVVFSDELNHASIIDGLKLSGARIVIFPHRDLDFLHTKIAQESKSIQKFLVTESLFSMDGTFAPLKNYAEISQKHNISLIIDEAHALGIYGHQGAGLIDYFSIGEQVLCRTAGMGKAFGTFGAVVGGRAEVIELILQRARSLIFTTALPPLALCAILTALDIIKNGDARRQKLFANINLLNANLKITSKETPSPILPIIIGENSKTLSIASKLQEAGFDIRAIRPPTVPEGTARLRITSHSGHKPILINSLTNLLGALL